MRPSSPPLRRDSLPAGPHRRERRAARIQQRMSLRQRLPSGRSAPPGMSCGLCPAGRGLRRIASFWPAPSGNVMRPVSGSARSAPRFLSGRPVRTAGNVMRPVSGRARSAPNCFLPSGPARTAGECGVACVRQGAVCTKDFLPARPVPLGTPCGLCPAARTVCAKDFLRTVPRRRECGVACVRQGAVCAELLASGLPAPPLSKARRFSPLPATPLPRPGPAVFRRPQNAKTPSPRPRPLGPPPAATTRQRERAGPRGLGARPPARGRTPPMITAAHSGGRRRCLCFQHPHDTAFRSIRQGVRSFGRSELFREAFGAASRPPGLPGCRSRMIPDDRRPDDRRRRAEGASGAAGPCRRHRQETDPAVTRRPARPLPAAEGLRRRRRQTAQEEEAAAEKTAAAQETEQAAA